MRFLIFRLHLRCPKKQDTGCTIIPLSFSSVEAVREDGVGASEAAGGAARRRVRAGVLGQGQTRPGGLLAQERRPGAQPGERESPASWIDMTYV